MEASELESWVEAALFMAGKRLQLREIASLLEVSTGDVARAVRRLQAKYNGPLVVRLDGDTALMTVEGRYVNELWMLGKGEMSNAELKTLATIAYYEPVRQSEVAKARGNRAYEHVRKLEHMGLIASTPQGNTKLLRLTRKFYDYFGEDVAERIRSAPTVAKHEKEPEPSKEEGGEDMEEGFHIRIRDVGPD